jgi:hypothetical protein
VLGLRMSARSQLTLCDQGGGSGEDVTEDQTGSPERLEIELAFFFFFHLLLKVQLIDILGVLSRIVSMGIHT